MSFIRIAGVCAVLLLASIGWAGVIDNTVLHYPWVKSDSGTISYNSDTGALDVSSWPIMYNQSGEPGGGKDLVDGYFELHVIIDPALKTVVVNPSYTDGPALFVSGQPEGGVLRDMFSSNRPAEFDYNFDNQGQIAFRFWQDGQMEPPDNGNVVVQIWAAGATGFDSSLNSATLYVDTFYLPDPATVTLLVLGGLAVLRRRRSA